MKMRRPLRASIVLVSVLAISMGTALTAVNNVPRTFAGLVTIPVACQSPVTIDIKPETLNQQNGNDGPSVTVQVHFPNGTTDPGGVAGGTMRVAGEQQTISSLSHSGNAYMFKFSSSDVLSLVGSRTGEITFVVDGWLSSCRFTAQDTITVMAPAGDEDENEQQSTQQKSTNEPVQIQGEAENVEQVDPVSDPPSEEVENVENVEHDDSTSEPGETDPSLDIPEQSEHEDFVSVPEQEDPPDNETDSINKGDPVHDSQKSGSKTDEPDTVTKEEDVPVKEPVKVDPALDETDIHEDDIPVKEPLEIDSPAHETKIVEEDEQVNEPVDEPQTVDEDTIVIKPISPRSQVEQPERGEQDIPVDEPETPDPVVAEPEIQPVEPIVEPPVESTPPESVEEEPEAVEHCPIDAVLRITQETLDLNGEVDEALLTVRFPESVAGAHSVDGLALVEVRVKLGEDWYGALSVEATQDAENPLAGEFELTLEDMLYLLEGRLGEVTLEVRGAVDGCEFAGTDTLQVIATPVVEEPEEVLDETGEGGEPVEGEPEQTEPPEDTQEQTETTTTEDEEEVQAQTVEESEQVGVLEEEDESEDSVGPE